MRLINKCRLIFIVCCELSSLTVSADSGFYRLRISQSSQKFAPGANITLTCTVDTSRTGTAVGTQWFRHEGGTRIRIATELMPNQDFSSNDRYIFGRGAETLISFEYTLLIRSLRLEDSTTIECGSPSFSKNALMAVAVCTNPQHPTCDCMVQTGWASPACFDVYATAKQNYDQFQRATIGLGVALAVMICCSIVLTTWVIKACIKERKKARSEESERLAKPEPPAISLAPPGASALKQQPRFGSPNSGHQNVRFHDDDRDLKFCSVAETSSEAESQRDRRKDIPVSRAGSVYSITDKLQFLPPDANTHKDNRDAHLVHGRTPADSQDSGSKNYQPSFVPHLMHSTAPQQLYVVSPARVVFYDPGSTMI